MDCHLTVLILAFVISSAVGWVPPGMSEHIHEQTYDNKATTETTISQPSSEQEHIGQHAAHTHTDNINVADVIVDAEHIVDDIGEIFTEKQIDHMDLDEKLFLWFQSHDWDENNQMDGLELLKSLSHDHNYHHPDEETNDPVDVPDDAAQHTAAAERQRLRRTEKIVDKMLSQDDTDQNGEISFSEFVSAFRAGNMHGLKVKKT